MTTDEIIMMLAVSNANCDRFALRAAIEALQADARRYRWLRDIGDKTWVPLRARYCRGPMSVDQDIDAAMALDKS
jgi:hypothetical protein